MKLKAIDVSGFKSFADKIKLNFDDGITAVVGPNGSGKSNIADAIRWVLGEQSVKTLRGGKMEDIIFNGTATRKAQGMASVSLLIDNCDHSLGIDAAEVAITRKLYRSGESEYRINENQVRLKDINELFMDTGIGRDGYAIIGQGKVSEIVSARSKERREIFEEAAGISKFRYRKSEAEKQLLQSEENLNRLKDILAEIETRVGPLRLQSEKARKFLALSEEKKALEISISVHNLKGLNLRKGEIEDKLILAQQQLDEFQSEADLSEEEYESCQAVGRALNIEIDDLRRELENATLDISQKQSRIAVLNNDIQHFSASEKDVKDSFNKTNISKEENIITRERLLVEKETLSQELTERKSKQESVMGRQQEILQKQEDALKAYENTKLKRAAIFDALERARIKEAESKSVIKQSSERLSQIEEIKSETENQIKQIGSDILDCQNLFKEIEAQQLALSNSILGYTLKKEARQKRQEELGTRLTAAENEISAKKQRAKLLTDMENSLEGFGQSVKFIINAKNNASLGGIIGTVSSVISSNEKYSQAIETALGQGLQNIITETQEDAKSAIYKLKSQRAGRATFLPLDTIKASPTDMRSIRNEEGFEGIGSELISFDPRFTNIINWILGRIIIATDLNYATAIAKHTGYKFKVVTLDGQVVNAGGSLTGGFSSNTSGILSRKNEIAKLLSDADKISSGMQAEREKYNALNSEIKSLISEATVIEARQKTLNEDKIRTEAHEKSLALQKHEKESTYNQIIRESELTNARIAEITDKTEKSAEIFDSLNSELGGLQEELIKIQEVRNALLIDRENVLKSETAQDAEIAILESRIANIASEIEKLSLIISDADEERESIALKLQELNDKAVTARAEIEKITVELKENSGRISDFESKTNRKITERTQNEFKLTELREKERVALSKRDEFYKEVVRLTQQKDGAAAQINTIISALFDQYELSLSLAQEMAKPLDDIAGSIRILNELKGKIKMLGSVNMGAIEEYDEVSLRFEELSRQIEDIESAKKELTRLIHELTTEMCTIFTQKFARIDENFQRIFKQLFGGGNASLSLSEPEDILESGIEISVTPPGKVIKNLASLSGGEQSFVAIAIFFAILKVNPSPFCLMDEIEAALDDVNVAKFASFLHTLTDKTQFITITHRRGTMEEADVLYGVTMQEEGVSKLLRLDASHIEKDFYK